MMVNIPIKDSFIELSARERVNSILDPGTFREVLGPFDRMESPHLSIQGIVPQSDDGVVVGRGLIEGESAVVIAIEGDFQGGGIGEVSGAKIAGALELVLRDHENGVCTRPVMILETGGVRLQEGNYGLLAIAEIGAAIVALRPYTPVVGIIAGMIGCFGGMSICAGLCSHIIMTRQGRLELNGPEVIEQEAGILEFDSSNRQMIWEIAGGEQRYATGFADKLVDDDIKAINSAVIDVFSEGIPTQYRSSSVDRYLSFLSQIDPTKPLNPRMIKEIWENKQEDIKTIGESFHHFKEQQVESKGALSRGRVWIEALSGQSQSIITATSSVICVDSMINNERVRYISVVPSENNRFPRARQGEVGLDEGWAIAYFVQEAIREDKADDRRAIVAIVDVPSQAYGYREELLGINLACAAAADAYASARLAGHPVISLIVGNAISGAFLAHGLQANRLIALDAPDVTVQVMSKESASRITRRSIKEIEETAKKIPATAYDIQSFFQLGALTELVQGINADAPDKKDIQHVLEKVQSLIIEVRSSKRDLSNRLQSAEAGRYRFASIRVRELLAAQWN